MGLVQPSDLIDHLPRPHPSKSQRGARTASHPGVGCRKASHKSVRITVIRQNWTQWGTEGFLGRPKPPGADTVQRASLDPDG